VKTGDVYAFQDGRTLPIKVRIGRGRSGRHQHERLRGTGRAERYPERTLDVTTNTGFAGAASRAGGSIPIWESIRLL